PPAFLPLPPFADEWAPPTPPPGLSPLHWTPDAPFPIPKKYVDKLTRLHELRDEAQEVALNNAKLQKQFVDERKLRLYIQGLIHPEKEGIPEYARETRLANRKRQHEEDEEQDGASADSPRANKRQREEAEEYDDVDPRDVYYEAKRAEKRKRNEFDEVVDLALGNSPKCVRFDVPEGLGEKRRKRPTKLLATLPKESELTEEDKAYEAAERAKDIASGDPRAKFPEWIGLGSFFRGHKTLEEIHASRFIRAMAVKDAGLKKELAVAREMVMRAASRPPASPEEPLLFGSGPGGRACLPQSSIFSTPLTENTRLSWPAAASTAA
ncbi:hypothetical protein EVG20_g4373, partial [Dentipellis fragilis]